MGPVRPLLLMLLLSSANMVEADSLVIATECRVGTKIWSSCSVAVIEPGSRWQLNIGSERWSIKHNGTGTVQLRQGKGSWKSAQPRWEEAGALCWGPVCTKGPLPLD